MNIKLSTKRGLCTIYGDRVEMPYLSLGSCIDVLFRIPRFGGQGEDFYTVGDHVLGIVKFIKKAESKRAIPEIAAKNLLTCAIFHDLAEVVMGDVKNPIKNTRLKKIELRILARMLKYWQDKIPKTELAFSERPISSSYMLAEKEFSGIDYAFSRLEHISFFGYEFDKDKSFSVPKNYHEESHEDHKSQYFRLDIIMAITEVLNDIKHAQAVQSFSEMTKSRSSKLKQITRAHLSCLTKNKISEETFKKLEV